MEEGANHMFFDHADRDAQSVGDLRMGVAFKLVHDESLAACLRQFIEINCKPGKLPAVLIGNERAVREIGIRQCIEIDSP